MDRSEHTTSLTAHRPTLPPDRAFVVQIHADAEPARGTLVGRVEHLASGTTVRFTTPEQLVAFIRRTIGHAGKETTP